MRILVTSASRHGSSTEIAMRLASQLEQRLKAAGIPADVCIDPVEEAAPPDSFDAVVLGSAVYMGRWLASARSYASSHLRALRERPVWLFSSGPVGMPPLPATESPDTRSLGEALRAQGTAVFPGRLDRALLRMSERVITAALHAQDGDFRDWESVDAWAAGISATMAARRLGDQACEVTVHRPPHRN